MSDPTGLYVRRSAYHRLPSHQLLKLTISYSDSPDFWTTHNLGSNISPDPVHCIRGNYQVLTSQHDGWLWENPQKLRRPLLRTDWEHKQALQHVLKSHCETMWNAYGTILRQKARSFGANGEEVKMWSHGHKIARRKRSSDPPVSWKHSGRALQECALSLRRPLWPDPARELQIRRERGKDTTHIIGERDSAATGAICSCCPGGWKSQEILLRF